MSKIGRKPIKIDGLTIDVKGQAIHYKGLNASGVYHLAPELNARVEGSSLYLVTKSQDEMSVKEVTSVNCLWGLHRALLANELGGAVQEFEKMIEINGL